MSRSAGFGEAPQQAFSQPLGAVKSSSVATLELLAKTCTPLDFRLIKIEETCEMDKAVFYVSACIFLSKEIQ